MDQLSITNQIHCCTHSELAEEAIQLSDTRHVLVSVHVTGGVVTSAALHKWMHAHRLSRELHIHTVLHVYVHLMAAGHRAPYGTEVEPLKVRVHMYTK